MSHISDTYPLGTFFATSWGYDQTNVEFYKVVGFTEKCLRLQPWTRRTVSEDGPTTMVEPGDGPVQVEIWEFIPEAERDADRPWEYRRRTGRTEDAETFVLRARLNGHGTTIRGHYASVFDGTPRYATTSGWGH